MVIKLDGDPIMEKMKELCETLLGQEAYKELRDSIDRFASDEPSLQQYERFMEEHQHLRRKEDADIELTSGEIARYEQEERALYDNDVIRKFLYAQREFGQLHDRISQYFTKTIELDRLPESGDLKKGDCGCGGSCGSGHGH
ncbi:YlbF family regulator [Cohnella cellulosilytica]|uniref:YlbF family regulator n=1 Tax=Cohnella cellulosilytica TaxID=986710 RepID=A0ABW2F519_9BACL